MRLPIVLCTVADYSAAVVSVVAALSAAAVAVMRQWQAPARGRRTDNNGHDHPNDTETPNGGK